MERQFKYFSIVTSVLLMVLSIVFYLQRDIMYDSSFYFFDMLETKGFCIQHYRYPAVLSQLLPFLFIKASLPLKWIAVAYSLNLALIAVVLSLLSGYWLKNWKAAAAIVLSPFLFNSEMFFWMVAESQYLPLYWLFIYAFIDNCIGKSLHPLRLLLLLLLLFLGFTIHPLSIFCFFALMLYLLITKRYTEPIFLFTIVFSVFVFILKTKMVSYSNYDKGAMEHVANWKTLYPYYFNISTNRFLLSLLWNKLLMISVFFVLGIAVFVRHRKYIAGFLFALLVLGFMLFTNVCFYDIKEGQSLYFENLYQPLVFMLLVPFVFIFKLKFSNTTLLFLFVFSVLFGLGRTIKASEHYTQRLYWERAFIKKYEDKKLVIHSSFVPMDLLGQPWCTPFEFALLSALENKRTTSHLVTFDVYEVPIERIIQPHGIVHQNGWIPFSKLDKRYFNFTDTTHCYSRVSPW